MTSTIIAEAKTLENGVLEITPKQRFTLRELAEDFGEWATGYFANIPGLVHHVRPEGIGRYGVYLSDLGPEGDIHVTDIIREGNRAYIKFFGENSLVAELAKRGYQPFSSKVVLQRAPSDN